MDSAPLLRLIDDGQVAAILDKHRLADLEDALVGLDKSLLEEVSHQRAKVVRESTLDGTPHTVAPNLEQIKVIVQRHHELNNPKEAEASRSTLRRWKSKLLAAEGDIRSLAPNTHLRGNRTRRIGDENLRLIADAINECLLVPNAGTITAAYCAYVNAHALRFGESRLENNRPVSLPTFFSEVSRISPSIKAAAQGGVRPANALAPPVEPNERALAPLRPFERAHIDHYLIDQHVVVLQLGDKKKITKRPWLTVMIDQATHVILAISISFRSPSRYACACVVRDCVRRHGRLPETIVVDHGVEFESVYFECLLARYGITKHERPPHAPRFGGPIESTFHSLREELIRSLDGSTSNDQQGRAVSPSHRGQSLATWRLREVYVAYEGYFFRHFNLKVRGTSICSADHHFDEAMEAFPFSGISVDYDISFEIATSIPLEGKYSVTHNRGITHYGRWYFHAGLLKLPNGTKVDAVEDPWDDGRLYVFANGRWLTCLSGTARTAQGSFDLRMLRSIEFLEVQSTRRQEALAQRVAIEAQTDRLRAKSGQDTRSSPEFVPVWKGKNKRPPAPKTNTSKPDPYITHEGQLDGHPTNRK